MHPLIRSFYLILCLAFVLPNGLAQTITLPSPETIATKDYVQQELQKLKESLNGQQPVPEKPIIILDPCKAGPEIRRIYNIAPSGLNVQFHGVQVTGIKWTVFKRLLAVASGQITPTSSILNINLSTSLSPGEYTLKLEGANCSGSSIEEFTVPNSTGGGATLIPIPDQEPKPGGELGAINSGVDYSISGDWQARYITGLRTDFQINSIGKISDNYPDKYDSKGQRYSDINGQKYNAYYLLESKRIADIKDLGLPPGMFYIQKMYVRAVNYPDWDSVQKAWWQLSPEDQKLLEVSNTELLVAHKNNVGSNQYWYQPTFPPQFYKHVQHISRHKISGFKNQYSVPDATLIASGISHLQDTGGGNNIEPDRKFTLAKLGTAGGNAFAPVETFYQAGYNYALNTGVSKKLVLTEEIGEEINATTAGQKRDKTNAFHRGYLQAFKDRYPGIKISDLNTFGGYDGVGNVGNVGNTYKNPSALSTYRRTMESRENARKAYNPSFNNFSETNDIEYFSSGKSELHNILIRKYFSSLADLNGEYFPSLLFTSQKLYLADPTKRQLIFTWEGIQDLLRLPNSFFDVADGWRYVFKEPAGKLYVGYNNGTQIPPYIAYGLGFLSPLLTEGFVVWSGSMPFKDVPLEGNHKNIFGGDYDGNGKWTNVGHIRQWMPKGSNQWQDYGTGGPGKPAYHPNANPGFPKSPHTAVDGFYAGIADYTRIENRVNRGKYWAKFSTDGGNSWYTPEQGSNGLKLADFEQPNYSAKHPAIDVAAFKLPIVIIGEGDAGSVLIYYNTYKLPTDSDEVVIQYKDKIYNIGQLRGSKIHTILL